jgi:hypothetical protein
MPADHPVSLFEIKRQQHLLHFKMMALKFEFVAAALELARGKISGNGIKDQRPVRFQGVSHGPEDAVPGALGNMNMLDTGHEYKIPSLISCSSSI